MTFSVVTANLWKRNPQIERDLAVLVGTGAEFIGLNEALNFTPEIQEAARRSGYRLVGNGAGKRERQVPVLVRDDIPGDWQQRILSRHVDEGATSSPERVGTAVRATVRGRKVAVLNFHANAGVQAGPARPHRLARVAEFRRGTRRLTAWVRELEADGYAVIVLGDLNWAWTSRAAQWLWSPRRVFRRLGMVTQYDMDNPPRPKGDRRRIEYVAWSPRRFRYVRQNYVTPEKSDHPWIEVTLAIKEP